MLPDRCVGMACEDVSARTRAAQIQEGERAALEMLAAGAPLPAILTRVTRLIDELSPGSEAAILLAVASYLLHTRQVHTDFLRRWVNWETYLARLHPEVNDNSLAG